MGQMNRGVHNHNSHKCSDEMTPALLPPQGMSVWGQLTNVPNRSVHKFTGDMSGKRQNIASHINKDSTPYRTFMLYLAAVIILLVEESYE
jgi:hypothetical protein